TDLALSHRESPARATSRAFHACSLDLCNARVRAWLWSVKRLARKWKTPSLAPADPALKPAVSQAPPMSRLGGRGQGFCGMRMAARFVPGRTPDAHVGWESVRGDGSDYPAGRGVMQAWQVRPRRVARAITSWTRPPRCGLIGACRRHRSGGSRTTPRTRYR